MDVRFTNYWKHFIKMACLTEVIAKIAVNWSGVVKRPRGISKNGVAEGGKLLEKPTLQAAIEWGRERLKEWDQVSLWPEKEKSAIDKFLRLVRAGEQSAEKDWRVEKLKEKLKNREWEQEQLIDQLSALRDQLAEKEREIERLADELEDLELSTNPEFISGMTLILEGLEKTKIDWSKVKERTVLVDDPEPTQTIQERLDVHWEELQRFNRIGFPGRLGILEKKLEILAEKNPGCFDDSTLPETQ